MGKDTGIKAFHTTEGVTFLQHTPDPPSAILLELQKNLIKELHAARRSKYALVASLVTTAALEITANKLNSPFFAALGAGVGGYCINEIRHYAGYFAYSKLARRTIPLQDYSVALRKLIDTREGVPTPESVVLEPLPHHEPEVAE